MKTITKIGLFAGIATATMAGQCESDATVASRNLSTAAGNFEIMRRVVFYNGITGGYMMEFQGRCSIKPSQTLLRLTCKHGPEDFRTHYLGLSDNVTYFVEQMDGASVSTYHTRVIWKPQSILPDIDYKGSAEELLDNKNTDG